MSTRIHTVDPNTPRSRGPRCLKPRGTQHQLLFDRYRRHRDAAAREALVRSYLPLARSLARRYARSSEPFEDLCQVASLALVKAIERFDPHRGVEFRAFAIPTILGELKRHFRDSAWAVHVPRGIQERALLVQEATERLTNRGGRQPSVPELALYLELSIEDVLDGLRAAEAYDALSLDESPSGPAVEDEDSSLGETLGAEDARYELIEADIALTGALRSLGEHERRILRMRFIEERTQSEIAERIGISQMQVSRVSRRAVTKLRALATG
jgi:RNA polymerase sigma-B factor